MEAVEYVVPARVVSVINGRAFLAMADLGWNVSVATVVFVDGLDTPRLAEPGGMEARKAAQRLLQGAELMLRSRRLFSYNDRPAVLADVYYAQGFTPHSEEGSFRAAMYAAGHAIERDGQESDAATAA